MAIQFINNPNPNKYAGLEQGLGQLLGGLGGVALGYGANKLGFGGEDEEMIKRLVDSGTFTKEQAAVYRKLATPQERNAFMTQTMKQNTAQRNQELVSQAYKGEITEIPKENITGVNALDGLGEPSKKETLEELEDRRNRILQTGVTTQSAKDTVSAIDRQIDAMIKKESMARKEKMEEKKQSYLEQKDINKETRPFYDSIKERFKAAQDNNMRLSRQKEKIAEGKLVGPGLYKLMKSMGIPLDPNSAEFEKLTNDYLKNAKATFGARLTDFDVRTFLSTVPSLETSDAAKLYVINNLELFNEATIAENKAMNEIIKENGGKRPSNLEEQVEERTKDIKDDIARRFKEGLKDIPEESNWEWVKRVGTGPISGAIGSVAKAAPGAIIGGLVGGPMGALAGGALGHGAIGSVLGALGGK